MQEDLEAEYDAIIERLNAPCDCDCRPNHHWCFLCQPHGAFTREIVRAYHERLNKFWAAHSEAHG